MENLTNKLGFWSAILIALLVLLIDVGIILSTILFPMTTITNIETYAAKFTSWQMLPFVPSFILAPMFAVMILCIYHSASPAKKILGQLSFSFSIVCAAILSIHYYIQLTVMHQGLLTKQTEGLWLFASPNPHSLFWTFAALGYGFMGIALLFASPIFREKSENKIRLLFIAVLS
jgi:hypothetical protein